MWKGKLASLINRLTLEVHGLLKPFVSEEVLLEWKPIHLCWWFRKNGFEVPKYFIAANTAPTVTTQNCTNVLGTTATGNGTVTATGGVNPSVRAVCYMAGTSGDPTTANSLGSNAGSGGTGAYTSNITGLTPASSYRVRAYATNTKGTAYGATVQLTTNTPPTVALNTPADDATVVSTTPDLKFTGTDVNSDQVDYQIEVDTATGFNSSNNNISNANGTTNFLNIIRGGTATSGQGTQAAAQSFTTIGAITITSIDLKISKFGAPYDNLVVTIRSTSQTGTVLGTATIAGTDLSTGAEIKNLVFDNSISLSASTTYYIVLDRSSGTNDGSNYYVPTGSTSNTYSDGIVSTRINNVWADITGDYYFVLYAPIPLISALSTDHTGFSAGASHPTASGVEQTYTIQAPLVGEGPFYWRVRAIDPSGSNTWGDWSPGDSTLGYDHFHISTGTAVTVNSGVQTLTSSQPALTVSSVQNRTNSVAVQTGNISQPTPTITASSPNVQVNPAVQSLTASLPVPTVTAGSVSDWYNASWGYRVKVTILASKVDADLTGYPVYVNLNNLPAEFHSNVNQTDARDIRVTTSDGVTEVPREVVFYTAASDTGELHFKGDVDSDTNTDFYIYYGNAAASDYAVTETYGARNVWDANYKGVWHLKETGSGSAGDYKNSVSAVNNSANTTNQPAIDASGQIGAGQSFGGTSADQISFGNDSSLDMGTGNFTLSGWIKTSSATRQAILNKYYTSDVGIFLDILNTGRIRFVAVQTTGSNLILVDGSTTTVANGEWRYIVGVRKSATTGEVYLDGNSDGTQATGIGNANVNTSSASLYAGNTDGGYSAYVTGSLDELRISNTNRSSTWISTEYNNQKSPSTFYQIGEEEEPSAGTAITVNPSVQTATLSLPAPTVTAIRNLSTSPAVQTSTFSTPAPTVTGTRNVSNTTAVQTLTASQPTQAVSPVQNKSISTSVLTSTFSQPNITVSTTRNLSTSPEVLTGNLSQPDLTVSAIRNVSSSTDVQTLTISQPVPSIQTESEVNIQVDTTVQSLTSSQPTATVTAIRNISQTTAVQTATFSQPIPTVTTTRNVSQSASVQTATLSQPNLTVSPVRNISSGQEVQTATFSVPSASLTTTRNVSLSPNVQSSQFALPEATVSTAGSVTTSPDVQLLTASLPAPTVAAVQNVRLSETVQSATFTTPDITVTPQINVSSSLGVQSLNLSITDATVTAIQNISQNVEAQTASLSQPNPTVSTIQNRAYPAAVQTLTASAPDPSVFVGGVVLVPVAVQTATLNLPSPIVSTIRNISITPNAQEISVTAPDALVSAIQNADVAVDVASVSLTQNTPTITAIRSALVRAGVQSGTFSSPNPTMTTTRNASISPSVQTLALALQAIVLIDTWSIETETTSSWTDISEVATSWIDTSDPSTSWTEGSEANVAWTDTAEPTTTWI